MRIWTPFWKEKHERFILGVVVVGFNWLSWPYRDKKKCLCGRCRTGILNVLLTDELNINVAVLGGEV